MGERPRLKRLLLHHLEKVQQLQDRLTKKVETIEADIATKEEMQKAMTFINKQEVATLETLLREKGTPICIIGPQDSGKSTLIGALLDIPDVVISDSGRETARLCSFAPCDEDHRFPGCQLRSVVSGEVIADSWRIWEGKVPEDYQRRPADSSTLEAFCQIRIEVFLRENAYLNSGFELLDTAGMGETEALELGTKDAIGHRQPVFVFVFDRTAFLEDSLEVKAIKKFQSMYPGAPLFFIKNKNDPPECDLDKDERESSANKSYKELWATHLFDLPERREECVQFSYCAAKYVRLAKLTTAGGKTPSKKCTLAMEDFENMQSKLTPFSTHQANERLLGLCDVLSRAIRSIIKTPKFLNRSSTAIEKELEETQRLLLRLQTQVSLKITELAMDLADRIKRAERDVQSRLGSLQIDSDGKKVKREEMQTPTTELQVAIERQYLPNLRHEIQEWGQLVDREMEAILREFQMAGGSGSNRILEEVKELVGLENAPRSESLHGRAKRASDRATELLLPFLSTAVTAVAAAAPREWGAIIAVVVVSVTVSVIVALFRAGQVTIDANWKIETGKKILGMNPVSEITQKIEEAKRDLYQRHLIDVMMSSVKTLQERRKGLSQHRRAFCQTIREVHPQLLKTRRQLLALSETLKTPDVQTSS